MAIQIQLRQGTTTEHNTFTGAVGEVTVDTTNKTLRVHDGTTVGGTVLAKVSEVPSLVPQATESVVGASKIATTAIAQAGTNGTDIITPATLKGCLDAKALGINQTWQDVTTSRSSATTYTNSSTAPIMLSIAVRDGGVGVILYVNGFIAIRLEDLSGGSSGYTQIVAIVPAGNTYRLDASNNPITFWGELK